MEMKIKYRSRRYDIRRPRSRHGHNYSKCKKCQYDDGFMYYATTKQYEAQFEAQL